MSQRGHRKLRLCSRKHYEAKKYTPKSLIVSLPLSHVSALKVSIPLSALCDATVGSLEELTSRLGKFSSEYSVWKEHKQEEAVSFYQLNDKSSVPHVTFCVRVDSNLGYSIAHSGATVDLSRCGTFAAIPSCITSVTVFDQLLRAVRSSYLCEGNSDNSFLNLHSCRRGVFKDRSGTQIVAKIEASRTGQASIFHKDCEVLVAGVARCRACTEYRKTLRAMIARSQLSKTEVAHPSSHSNYCTLSSPDKDERLRRLKVETKNYKRRIDRLQEKIELAAVAAEVSVDASLDADLRCILTELSDTVYAKHPQGSFKRLFWEQQEKSASLRNSRSMKWHPLFIKWCLYLRHLSGRAYEMLRESGCVKLPSQRTLRDYTHYVSTMIGFSAEIDEQLLTLVDLSEEQNKYVGLIMDEVHVRDDLVYDKHNGVLVGFTNLGNSNDHLLQFEASINEDAAKPSLATSMLVLMIRGIFSKLTFPYAQFTCHKLSSDLLVDPVWETVSRLDRQGFRVMFLKCNGASTNCRLWKMHSSGEKLTYKVNNIFASDRARPTYFISDVPHLIKTVRNCWWNNKRNLEYNGKQISWCHLEELYKEDTRASEGPVGLRLVPKLKYEHIHLSSFSKMRVDLAVQVLSESVYKALLRTAGDEVSETVKFVKMMDSFFDCLNVNNFNTGRLKRKVFQDPYRSKNDSRLKWLKDDFLGYLKNWEDSVMGQTDIPLKKRKNMLLSAETRYGIEVTVHSFTELTEFAFTIPGVEVFLSERLSQDPLEKFFGCQRQRGGTSENPNVAEFCKNTQALRVINSVCGNVSRGNCRGNKHTLDMDKENTPLPKRKHHHK